jgi:predicted HD superfamily hydrolase involved in NAD metabolism
VGTSISVPGAVVDRIRRRMNRVPPALCDHCKRVEQIARELAERHGEDADAAGLAGLAHDAAKHFSATELLLRVEEYDLPANDFELRRAPILHGPIGAEMLRREDRLNEPSLYDAVYWHTTGNPSGGDRLGQIVFLADKLDPIKVDRYPWQPELRELADQDLKAASAMFLTRNIGRLLDAGAPVHPAAIDARNALLWVE